MNCFHQTRKFVMAEYNVTEAEATTIITQGVDFAVTQVVDGNWGVHAVVPKQIFVEFVPNDDTSTSKATGTRKLIGNADITLSLENVHWGYFSKTLTPVLTVESGSEVIVEMATHHACDDWDKMIKGDVGMEDIYTWNNETIGEGFRGATGCGDGIHILTGPIFIEGGEPGDILKVDIMDLVPRVNPDGKTYGSNAAAWWGFQARINKVNGEAFFAGSLQAHPMRMTKL